MILRLDAWLGSLDVARFRRCRSGSVPVLINLRGEFGGGVEVLSEGGDAKGFGKEGGEGWGGFSRRRKGDGLGELG